MPSFLKSRLLLVAQVVAIFALVVLIGRAFVENRAPETEAGLFREKFQSLEEERRNLEERIRYLNNPDNVEKELKSKHNIGSTGERVIILPKNDLRTE